MSGAPAEPPRPMACVPADADLVVQAPFVLPRGAGNPAVHDRRVRHRAAGARGMRCLPAGRAGAPRRGRRSVRRGRLRLRAGAARAAARTRSPRRNGHGFDADHDRMRRRDRGMQGIGDEVAAITAAAMRGEIDFRASLERRVALLAGLPVAALERVYDERLRLSPGAERLLATCQPNRRENAARVRWLHVLHRSAAHPARIRPHAVERARNRRRPADWKSPATSSMPHARPRDSPSSRSAIAATTASRSPSATAPTTCRCLPQPTCRSPIAPSRVVRAQRCTRSTTVASMRY